MEQQKLGTYEIERLNASTIRQIEVYLDPDGTLKFMPQVVGKRGTKPSCLMVSAGDIAQAKKMALHAYAGKHNFRVVEFVVPRASTEEHTYGVITAVVDKQIADAESFFGALRGGVRQFVDETPQGKDYLAATDEDLNIGDLVNEFPLVLRLFLRERGILYIDIEAHVDMCPHASMSYDSLLYSGATT